MKASQCYKAQEWHYNDAFVQSCRRHDIFALFCLLSIMSFIVFVERERPVAPQTSAEQHAPDVSRKRARLAALACGGHAMHFKGRPVTLWLCVLSD